MATTKPPAAPPRSVADEMLDKAAAQAKASPADDAADALPPQIRKKKPAELEPIGDAEGDEPVFDPEEPWLTMAGEHQGFIQNGKIFSPGGEYMGEYDSGPRSATSRKAVYRPRFTKSDLEKKTWRELNTLVLQLSGKPKQGPGGRAMNIAWLLRHR